MKNDSISRQAAIATIEHYLKHPPKNHSQLFIQGMDDAYYRTLSILRALPSAQPVAKDTNVPINDCISRQAAIDTIEAEKLKRGDYMTSSYVGYEFAENAIRNMPSAQPVDKDIHVPCTDTISRQEAILDVTCGSRTIWFQKSEPHTTYCDIRKEEWEGDFGKTQRANGKKKHRHLVIDPDILCSFTELPFEEESFNLVVFDPPHIEHLKQNSWMRKSYGTLDGDWKPMIKKGFEECMRVLKIGGVLIFKWSDISISTREIINVIGQEPLFGHRSGKKMNTHWMCYMKFNGGVNE